MRGKLLGLRRFLLLSLFFACSIHWNNAAAFPLPGEHGDPIKIGVLITADTTHDALAKQAVDALELVVDRVNATGGIGGSRIQPVIKSVEGNWGAGSKRSVNLIYEDGVSAIVGFLDGRSAHLVEQVCTKAQVPFLSVYSPDPTLSRINIPWFFSTMPHAGQQAKVLANEIYRVQKLTNVTIVASEEYDYRYLTRSFLRVTERNKKYPAPSVLTYGSGTAGIDKAISRVSGSDTEGIVFFGDAGEWSTWVGLLAKHDIQIPQYLPIMESDKMPFPGSSIPVFSVLPEGWSLTKENTFREEFYNTYRYRPGRLVSYAYDATHALLESIKRKGDGSTDIKQGLHELTSSGINSPISFDSSGVISGKLKIIQLN